MAERSRALRVFISSASGALGPYRLAAVEVCHRLGLTPVHMEEFSPERPPPVQVCRREIDSCAVVVLLVAHRYGSRPPGDHRSYTELEYDWALRHADRPLLAFVVDSDFPWPPLEVDRGPDAEALSRFVARVKSSHLVRPLSGLAKFREDLILALRPHETASASAKSAEPSGSAPRRVPSPPVFHAVPAYIGSAPFTGRSDDLAVLDHWGRSADPVMVIEAIGGTGKSALTWQWAQVRAQEVVDGLVGRLWWSFYDGSASITRFLREVLAYVSTRAWEHIERLERTELVEQVFSELRSRPYLLILDGVERLLAAYHGSEPFKLRDDKVIPAKRSLIEPYAHEVMAAFSNASPSKVLISTRLMPETLEGRFSQRIPGVAHLRLPGLTDPDTVQLLARLGVRGDESSITRFFGRLGNHPLLIGIVAGLIRDYRPDPTGFDRWAADPTAGGILHLSELDLIQRRAHILGAALRGLPRGHRRLLGWISVLSGAVDWSTLEAINPFLPEPPAAVQADLSPLGPVPRRTDRFGYPSLWSEGADNQTSRGDKKVDQQAPQQTWEKWQAEADRLHAEAARVTEYQQSEWRSSEPVTRARAQLDAALKDLEDRGLLWWDRFSNSYDLHPIVRACVHDQLEETDRIQANDRVRDHFQALPPEDPDTATSIEDLHHTITIFRALVGADRSDTASELWERKLRQALVVNLGAYAMIVELLTPLAMCGSWTARADLGIAVHFLGRYEEAVNHETRLLADALQEKNAEQAKTSLSWLGTSFARSGSDVRWSRCLELQTALVGAIDDQPDASLCLERGIGAALQGQVGPALALLNEADGLGPPSNSPWFESELRFWRLYLALVADGSLTEDRLTVAADDSADWSYRRKLARLQYEFFVRRGQFERALAATQECERLDRNAGIETIPARSAFLLAKLNRPDEASAAVQESLARLPRIHSAMRPHYELARALWELGRCAEATPHAHAAYRQAWRDGPPLCHHWDLQDVRELLAHMNEPQPDLPTLDPGTVTVPLENEVRAFIVKLAKKR